MSITQKNWRFYADDDYEPIASLAAENTIANLVNNTNIIRLRVIHNFSFLEAGGDFYVQYSSNSGANWTDLGPSAHWDYATGFAVENENLFGAFFTATTYLGVYHCSAGLYEASGANTEMDFSIKPTANVLGGTNYIFRFLKFAAVIPLASGATAPGVLTASSTQTKTISGTGGALAGGSATIAKTRNKQLAATGGALAGGSATIERTKTRSIISISGAIIGGAAVLISDFAGPKSREITSDGGALVGGAAEIEQIGLINKEIISDGGMVTGGAATFLHQLTHVGVSIGGAVVGGAAAIVRYFNIPIVGFSIGSSLFEFTRNPQRPEYEVDYAQAVSSSAGGVMFYQNYRRKEEIINLPIRLTVDQLPEFKNFFLNIVYGKARTFTYTDAKGLTYNVRFKESKLPRLSESGPDHVECTLVLRIV